MAALDNLPPVDGFLFALERHRIISPKAVAKVVAYFIEPGYDTITIKANAGRIMIVERVEKTADDLEGVKKPNTNGRV